MIAIYKFAFQRTVVGGGRSGLLVHSLQVEKLSQSQQYEHGVKLGAEQNESVRLAPVSV